MKNILCVMLISAGLCLAQDIHICVDSSANGYTLFLQNHESISYSPLLDTILIVDRGFVNSNYLNTTCTSGNLSNFATELTYQGQLGPARYPTAIAGVGLYISFPFLISGAWGGMGAQKITGSPVDVGNGDLDVHKVIGKQLPDSNLIFIGLTINNAILAYTWNKDLTQLIASTSIATNASYVGCDCNGGTFCIFYRSLSDSSIYYRTTIDGINWAPPQQWSIPLADSLSIGYMQMALTDNGEPRIVFDAYSESDNTNRIYVSYASGVSPALLVCLRDTICFYPTIATGGNYCAVLYCRSRNMGSGPANWWDFYMVWSSDNGITWGQPINCTQSLTYNPGLPQLAKRIDTLRMRAYYIYLAHIGNNDDPYWTLLYGTPTSCRIYLGVKTYTGIKEISQSAIRNPKLEVYPNPFKNHCVIKFQIPYNSTIFNPRSKILLKIYDVSGRVVKSFNPVSSLQNQVSSIIWDGCDNYGCRMPAGIYFVKLKTGDYALAEKMLLVR
ncbi:MAG: T9SS type A sorting domain-containing protein [candidate division WOR-3 bacterium]